MPAPTVFPSYVEMFPLYLNHTVQPLALLEAAPAGAGMCSSRQALNCPLKDRNILCHLRDVLRVYSNSIVRLTMLDSGIGYRTRKLLDPHTHSAKCALDLAAELCHLCRHGY